MSKVHPSPSAAYVPSKLITASDITSHFGVDTVSDLPAQEVRRYENYAEQANAYVDATMYKYVDTLPLLITDELRTYAKRTAFGYALWLKAVDDGAQNTEMLGEAWKMFRDDLINVMKSQPKSVNKRRVVSSGYKDSVTPYSQSYGVGDIL